MKKKKQDYSKKCPNEGCEKVFTPFNSLQKYCSWNCQKANEKPKPRKVYKAPNKVSKPQAIINAKYSVARIEYLSRKENQICFIEECNKKATTVEHRAGRGKGFFDKIAEEKNICKTLDTRFWAPCCWEHNLELERNSKLSKKYQLSKLHYGKKN